jgi:hypothetical protein
MPLHLPSLSVAAQPRHLAAIRASLARGRAALSRHDGQVVPLMAVFLTMFMLGGTLVVDAGLMLNDRRQAQNAVDMAALAAAQDLPWLPGDPSASAKMATARTTAERFLSDNRYSTTDPDVTVTITTSYQSSPSKIRVEASRVHHWTFGDFWGAIPTTNIKARAVAQQQAQALARYALMAMNRSAPSALYLNGPAHVAVTNGGGTYARSTSSSALQLKGNSDLVSWGNDVVGGGSKTSNAHWTPAPSPGLFIEDPLAYLDPPFTRDRVWPGRTRTVAIPRSR